MNDFAPWVKILLLPLLCAAIAGGFLWLPAAEGFQSPGLARIMVFHVPCAYAAYVASGVATWFAVRYLRGRQWQDDVKSRAAFALALVFWILTTVTGMIFAKAQWGAYWNWDIKQGSILMLTLVYVAYFALRAAIVEPRRQASAAAAYALFAVVSAPLLTLVLPNSTPDTLHPKGVLTTRDAISPRYWLVMLAFFVGLLGVSGWVFRLQVAVDMAEHRLLARTRRRSHAGTAVVTRTAP